MENKVSEIKITTLLYTLYINTSNDPGTSVSKIIKEFGVATNIMKILSDKNILKNVGGATRAAQWKWLAKAPNEQKNPDRPCLPTKNSTVSKTH